MFQQELKTTTITVDRAVTVQPKDSTESYVYTPRMFMKIVCNILRLNTHATARFLQEPDFDEISVECINEIQYQFPYDQEYLLFAMLGITRDPKVVALNASHFEVLGTTAVMSMHVLLKGEQSGARLTIARVANDQAIIMYQIPGYTKTCTIAAGQQFELDTRNARDTGYVTQIKTSGEPEYLLKAEAFYLTLDYYDWTRLQGFLRTDWCEIEIAYVQGYHVTYKDNLPTIFKDGLLPSEDGSIGPGVYLWTGQYETILEKIMEHVADTLLPVDGLEDGVDEDNWIRENCALVYVKYSGRVMRYSEVACCVPEKIPSSCIEKIEGWVTDWQQVVTGKSTELF